MSVVVTREVQAIRQSQPSAVVLDVRIEEDYAAEHLAGARHACVFEVAFVDHVRRAIPDPETPVVVYGWGGGSLESTDAARRLIEAGYRGVHNFPGGLLEWKGEGLPTLGSGPRPTPPQWNGDYPVDLAETRVEWTGRNLLNKHVGTVGVKSGRLTFKDDWLTGGEFEVDLTSVRCADIADPGLNATLLAHLASADFLDSGRHPVARLAIRKVGPVPDGRPGTPNLQLLTEVTWRGITRPVPVLAVAGRTPEGRMGLQASFALDRTDWGSAYGSARFFRSLGRHLVNDLIEIQVRVVA